MNKLASSLVIALVLTLASCSQDKDEKIVGKWIELKESPNTIEFFHDGKLLIQGESSIEGAWKSIDDGHIEMSITISGKKLSEIMAIEFVEDRIIATNSRGKSTESKRVEK